MATSCPIAVSPGCGDADRQSREMLSRITTLASAGIPFFVVVTDRVAGVIDLISAGLDDFR
jgi:hypothetical protein